MERREAIAKIVPFSAKGSRSGGEIPGGGGKARIQRHNKYDNPFT